MKKTILLVLAVAALAAAEITDLSHEVSAADVAAVMSSAMTPMLNRFKNKLTCQLKAVKEFEKKLGDCNKGYGVYTDCKDAYNKGQRVSRVYTLNPDHGVPFQAYCNMNIDGGGWTVFQRRKDGSVNFYRGWNDYVNGFGDLNGEHWLGLDKIYRLTKVNSVLRVDMTSYAKGSRYAKYTFRVGNSASKYTLSVSGYNGNAGNSLSSHNGMKFTTKDSDNDKWGRNCATSYKGAWWYNNCHYSNLNGVYTGNRRSGSGKNNCWQHFDSTYSLKFTEMKTRRK